MGQLIKTVHSYKGNRLDKFIFGEGNSFEMGHIFLAQSSFSFIIFKINL